MQYGLKIYLRYIWTDPRLAYGETETDAMAFPIALDENLTNKLWQPDLFFIDASSAYFHDVTRPNSLLRINPDGEIILSRHYTVDMICQMMFKRFPFDTQE